MTLACDCAPQCLLDPSSRNKGRRCCLSLLVELGAARRQNRSRRYLKSQQALRGTRQAGEARQPAGHSSFQIREPRKQRSSEEPLHLCSIIYGGSNLGSI